MKWKIIKMVNKLRKNKKEIKGFGFGFGELSTSFNNLNFKHRNTGTTKGTTKRYYQWNYQWNY